LEPTDYSSDWSSSCKDGRVYGSSTLLGMVRSRLNLDVMCRSKCPECEKRVSLWPSSLRECGRGIRTCPSCGSRIRLTNAAFTGGIAGLIFAVILISSHSWPFQNALLRMAVVVAVCWILSPFLFWWIAKWETLERSTDSGGQGEESLENRTT